MQVIPYPVNGAPAYRAFRRLRIPPAPHFTNRVLHTLYFSKYYILQVDAENETLIQLALTLLIGDKTVFIIARRMRTAAGADKGVKRRYCSRIGNACRAMGEGRDIPPHGRASEQIPGLNFKRRGGGLDKRGGITYTDTYTHICIERC